MAAELTPDDAVRAIARLATVLETMAQDLRALTMRSERWMRWHGRVLALVLLLTGGMLLASVWMFVVGVRAHTIQSDALRQVMQENRAIFERLQR